MWMIRSIVSLGVFLSTCPIFYFLLYLLQHSSTIPITVAASEFIVEIKFLAFSFENRIFLTHCHCSLLVFTFVSLGLILSASSSPMYFVLTSFPCFITIIAHFRAQTPSWYNSRKFPWTRLGCWGLFPILRTTSSRQWIANRLVFSYLKFVFYSISLKENILSTNFSEVHCPSGKSFPQFSPILIPDSQLSFQFSCISYSFM